MSEKAIDEDVLFSIRMTINEMIEKMEQIADDLETNSDVSDAASELKTLAMSSKGMVIVLDTIMRGDDIS